MARTAQKSGWRKDKYSASQLFNFAPNSYLERTSRPIYAVVFLLPFIIFYEVGTILINTDILNRSQVRVVAFVWLQDALEFMGFGSKFAWAAPAVVVLIILLMLQVTSGKKWQVHISDFWVMGAECVLLAVPLIVLTLFLNTTSVGGEEAAGACREAVYCQSVVGGEGSILAHIVTGIGAGIYEELIFRLMLIVLLMLVFQDFLMLEHRDAVILSVVLSALLFSAHHHIVWVSGQVAVSIPFTFREVAFRTLAGVYFACLFATRGFGITAGTHAFYDIIAVLVNAIFFA